MCATSTEKMKLRKLWNEYEKNPSYENEKLLCNRIRMLAKTVLKRFRIYSVVLSYEDLMQQAFVCFFECVRYCEDTIPLQGFFIVSFRNHVINSFRDDNISFVLDDIPDEELDALEVLIRQENEGEFIRNIQSLLHSDVERFIFEAFVLKGETNYKKIVHMSKDEIRKLAKKDKDSRTEKQIVMDTLQKIIDYYL